MKIFDLDDNYKIQLVRPTLAAIPEFAAMLTLNYNKRNGFKDPQSRNRARAEFLYIYLMYDFQSELRDLDDEDRHEQALEAAGLKQDYKMSDEMKAGIQRYIALQETRPIKAVRAAWEGIDKIIKFIDTAPPDKADELEKRIFNLGKLIEGLKKLEEQVRLDAAGEEGIRGQQETGRQG